MNDLSFRLGDRERYFADQADRDLRHEMKSRLRILQFSLSSFFVIVTLVAILVPLAWNLFHSTMKFLPTYWVHFVADLIRTPLERQATLNS